MGFYGNITNTSNTTFSFDRIYPNRLSMDANANNDGIFIGRYVLVEYQEKAAYPIAYHPTLIEGSSNQYYFYSSINKEEISKIKYLGEPEGPPSNLPSDTDINAIYKDGFYKGEILQHYEYSSEKKDWIFSEDFYKCVNGIDGYAIFEKIATPEMKSDYIQNFEIDENHYGQNSKGFKGYDSTVWVKSSVEQNGTLITKYVNIADLNSVVPTFDIAADAPTMNPITPHFDADSTNVYYKLHMQSPYGFRIAASEGQSDEDITWTITTYDKTTDTTTTETTEPFAGDIYYNKAGFNPLAPSKVENNNYIKLAPTARSGAIYSHGKEENDIQEFRLHLPAIGNMMSDAWDIIHGPNRDDDMREFDANGKNVSSLKGRLDSIDALEDDTIPVKRDADGKLVGNKINGGKTTNTDYTGKDDDEWIETLVNGNEETITIHHTYDLENKLNYKDIGHLEGQLNSNNDTTNNVDLNDGTNEFKINTPIVDSMGHVVGRNTEIIELPYGYKTIKTNGLIDNTDNDLDSSIGRESIADNTQDTLNIDTKNKWLQIEVTNDKVELAHEIHDIDIESNGHTNLNKETGAQQEDNLTIYDWNYDNAGHIVAKKQHTYTLPFSYKVIKTLNSEGVGQADIDLGTDYKIVANKTQDEMQFEAANKWIGIMATEEDNVDKIYLGHLTNGNGFGKTYYAKDSDLSNDDVYKQIPNFGDNVKILNVTVDNAGHVTGFNANTITIPDGSYTPANEATQHTDIITSIGFIPSSGAITSTKATTDTLTLSNYSANNGNLSILYTDTVNKGFEKIQNHINSLDMNSTSTTEFITKITQTDGQVAVERAAAGTLQLGTPSTDGTIPATSSLTNAFNITNDRIKAEEDALIKEVQDRKDAIDALTGTKDYSEHFDTMKEIADWLDANKDGVVDITLNVSANTKAISDEIALARSNEQQLTDAISEENDRATAVEQRLQDQINSLGTASTKAIEDFASAEQGVKAETAIQPTTDFIYTEEFRDTETDEILIPEVRVTIEQLVQKVAELEAEIKILKGE